MAEEQKAPAPPQAGEERLPSVDENAKKPGLMRGARDFLENTLSAVKGRDINQAVEEFTSEMTLVAEGLSEDQAELRDRLDRLSAQQTVLEEAQRRAEQEHREARAQAKALAERCERLEKRLDALEKAQRGKKDGKLAALIRQATWPVGIVCAAWVLVTLLKLLGG